LLIMVGRAQALGDSRQNLSGATRPQSVPHLKWDSPGPCGR
jgi:hypothetical protein